MINRGFLSTSPGTVFWNVAALDGSQLMSDVIAQGVYQHQALIPETPWIAAPHLAAVNVDMNYVGEDIHLTWSHSNSEQVSQLLVYLKYAQQWQYHIYSSEESVISVAASEGQRPLEAIKVIAIDRLGNQSDEIELLFQ
jgi:hypothetical protein